MIVIDELRDAWRSAPSEYRLALTVIFAFGVALRLTYITQPMRYDESVTYVYFVRLSWWGAISTYTYPNNHIFHTLLAKVVVGFFGNHPWAIRMPALLAGVAIIPTTFVFARELYGPRVALLASALVSTSAAMILYSTMARGYTMMVLAFMLLVLIGLRILRGGPGEPKTLWTAFVAISALGLWTIPSMLYPFGAVCLWMGITMLLDGKRADVRRLVIAAAVTAVLTVLLYWPVIAKENLDAITRNRFVLPSPWFQFLNELPVTLRFGMRLWGLGLPPAVSVLLFACAALALTQHAKITTTRVGLPVAIFAWSAWLLTVNHRAPMSRTWLWVLPVAAALAGAGIIALLEQWPRFRDLAERRLGAVALVLVVFTSVSVVRSFAILLTRDTGTYREASDAAAALRTVLRPGDRVLAAAPTNGPLEYYLDRLGADRAHLTLDENSAVRIFAIVDRGEGQTLEKLVEYSVVRDTATWARPVAISIPDLQQSSVVLYQRKQNVAPSK